MCFSERAESSAGEGRQDCQRRLLVRRRHLHRRWNHQVSLKDRLVSSIRSFITFGRIVRSIFFRSIHSFWMVSLERSILIRAPIRFVKTVLFLVSCMFIISISQVS